MKVFVSGATGVLGQQAVPALVAAGHQVSAVARTPAKAQAVRAAGAEPVAVDLFDATAVRKAVAGHHAVVNLATHIPPATRAARRGAWADNDRIRREVSAHLAEAALAEDLPRMVQESIGFLYADGGDSWLAEDAPTSPTPVTASALDAEANARRLAAGGGAAVVLRFGQFYGPTAGHTREMVQAARRLRVAVLPGPPQGFASSVHTDDLGPAVVAALEAPSGIYNVCDDEPVRRAEWAALLAAAVGRDRLLNPGRLAAALGGRTAEAVGRSQRMSNARFRQATGWAPVVPSVRTGLPATVAAISG
jgi:nucleoside-diphosphate-sugar epimerase